MNFHPLADGLWAMQPRAFQVGDSVTLDGRHDWTVKAVTEHFAALTRPIKDRDREEHAHDNFSDDLAGDVAYLDGEVFYTVLDWRNGYRGPCNLSGQSYGDGQYTEAECAEMLAEFEAGELEISHRNWVRIRFADESPAN
jgi:hypothetical protein